MLPGVLRALEFDRITEAVRSFALTPMGDARLARLSPASEPRAVAQRLAETTETARYLAANGHLALRAADDFPEILAALAMQQRALEPLRLLALASFMDAVDRTRVGIQQVSSNFPRLAAMSASIASFAREVAAVRRAIDPSGEVVDDASPALRGIRDSLRRQRGRLRGALESYLRGRETAKYLQDQVITERNGRFVIVVKAEHRGNVPGIVHGSSASGASLYLEPLDTVEINNEIVSLQERELEEIHRVLLQLTEGFRSRPLDVQRTVDAAIELDTWQARARFSDLVDGVQPLLSTDGAFELVAARHPLLMPAVAERIQPRAEDVEPPAAPAEASATGAPEVVGGRGPDGRRVRSTPKGGPVPVTIRVVPPASVLLVTGPNTGGKTVALKTAGLLALMAQAGLRIPAAEGSRLPVFRTVFADIGDEQSIEASLSTFSAHITNIAAMDRSLRVPALVLLDEVGSGTDPVEGGALGVAIVDHLRARGATVIATSHYDALKTYASTTAGVASAAFGFDADTFAPTYQLVYGTPGRSLALEIAARLGLGPGIIAAARQNVSERDAQLAEHLAKIDRDMRALDHERRLVARERETLRAAETRIKEREEASRQREETSRRRLTRELDDQVRRARREIDEVIGELKTKTTRLAREAAQTVTTGTAGEVKGQARGAVDAIVRRLVDTGAPAAPVDTPAPPVQRPPVVGDRVVVAGLGLEGVVAAVNGKRVDLDVRGKRMSARVADLTIVGGAPAQPRVDVTVDWHPRETMASDLNVIGCTVDEALARAERFLDETLLGDQREVRFIHGHGTGQLRRALTAFLQKHPLVTSVHLAPPEQGGGGVTVAELRD